MDSELNLSRLQSFLGYLLKHHLTGQQMADAVDSYSHTLGNPDYESRKTEVDGLIRALMHDVAEDHLKSDAVQREIAKAKADVEHYRKRFSELDRQVLRQRSIVNELTKLRASIGESLEYLRERSDDA